jgi:hypothetical protein
MFSFCDHKHVAKQTIVHSTIPFLDFLAMLYKLELKIVHIWCSHVVALTLPFHYKWHIGKLKKKAWLKQTPSNGVNIPNFS